MFIKYLIIKNHHFVKIFQQSILLAFQKSFSMQKCEFFNIEEDGNISYFAIIWDGNEIRTIPVLFYMTMF